MQFRSQSNGMVPVSYRSAPASGNYGFTVTGGHIAGVDNRLVDVLSRASTEWSNQTGGRVEVISGKDARDSTVNHPSGHAIDVQLIDASGRRLPNNPINVAHPERPAQIAQSFGAYEGFAQIAKGVQEQAYPELGDKFAWGGYFGPSGKTAKRGGNAFDLMHFDIMGARGAMGNFKTGLDMSKAGSWIPGAVSVGMRAGPNAVAAAGANSFSPEGRTISRASSRQQIAGLQSSLAAAGAYKGQIDGKWGPQTQRAVENFQHAAGISADGLAGIKTQSALAEAIGGPAGADVNAGIQARNPAAVGVTDPVGSAGPVALGLGTGLLGANPVDGLLGAASPQLSGPPRMAGPEQLAPSPPAYSAQGRPASEFASPMPTVASDTTGFPQGMGMTTTPQAAGTPTAGYGAPDARLTGMKQQLLGTLTTLATSPASSPEVKAYATEQMDTLAKGGTPVSPSEYQAGRTPGGTPTAGYEPAPVPVAAGTPTSGYDRTALAAGTPTRGYAPGETFGAAGTAASTADMRMGAASTADARVGAAFGDASSAGTASNTRAVEAAARLAQHPDMPDAVRQSTSAMIGGTTAATSGQARTAQSQEQRQVAAAGRLAQHPDMPTAVRQSAAVMAGSPDARIGDAFASVPAGGSTNARAVAAAARLAAHPDMPAAVQQAASLMGSNMTAGQNVAGQMAEQRQVASFGPGMPATRAIGDRMAEQRTRRDAGLPRIPSSLAMPPVSAPAITPASFTPAMNYDAAPAAPAASRAINAAFSGNVPAAVIAPQPHPVRTSTITAPPAVGGYLTPGFTGKVPASSLPTPVDQRIASAFSPVDFGAAPQIQQAASTMAPTPPAIPSTPNITTLATRTAPVPATMPTLGSASDAFSTKPSVSFAAPPVSSAIPAPAPHAAMGPWGRAAVGAGIGGAVLGLPGAVAGGLLGGLYHGGNPLSGLLGGNQLAGMQRTAPGQYSFGNGMAVNVSDMGAHPSGYDQAAMLDAGTRAAAAADRINGRSYSGSLPGAGMGGLW